jgi:hypothetical protein
MNTEQWRNVELWYSLEAQPNTNMDGAVLATVDTESIEESGFHCQ